MIRSKIIVAFFLLLIGLQQDLFAQINMTSDSTDDDSEVVDPEYKPLTKSGNSVNGKWYGIGNVVTTSHSNSYLCELLLKETKSGNVTGYFNYFFRDGYFSNKLYGKYDKSSQTFTFKPVIVLFHQTVKADIGVDVPMSGNFILNLNSKDTTLTGFLTPVSNYKYLVPALNIKLSIVGKNEPTLKERIRKRKLELEEDSDVATVLKETKKDSTNNKTVNKKVAEENNATLAKDKTQEKIQKNTEPNYKRDTIAPKNTQQNQYQRDHIVNNDQVNQKKNRDIITSNNAQKKTYQRDTIPPVFRSNKNKANDTLHFAPVTRNYQHDSIRLKQQIKSIDKAAEEEYKRRSTNLFKTLTVNDDSVTISLYDNGEFDHDMVSVFYNGKLIASNVELKTNVPAKFVVYLDATAGAKNELTLFAENLGTIPPNSALMIIEDTHDNRYEVNLKSDLSHNASVLLTPKLQ